MTIKAGDRIKDNDPRMPNRVLVVKCISSNALWVVRAEEVGNPKAREIRIARHRIYTDDKPRRSGFSVVRVESV